MEKFCPTVAVKGDKIILGEPVPLIQPEELPPELGIAPVVVVAAKWLAVPAIAATGAFFGLPLLGKQFEKAKPVFDALVPLAITGTGIYAFSQVTPLSSLYVRSIPQKKNLSRHSAHSGLPA